MNICSGGLAFERRVGGQNDLADPSIDHFSLQQANPELVRAYPFKGRQVPTQHQISAPIPGGAFNQGHGRRLLDQTEQAGIPARVGTDRAPLAFAVVPALGACTHPFGHGRKRGGQPTDPLARLMEEMESQALCRFPPDARELGQLQD